MVLKSIYLFNPLLLTYERNSNEVSMKYDIAILTCDQLENPDSLNWHTLQSLYEDEMLIHALQQTQLKVCRVSWSNPNFDWHNTRAVLFKSTWDYYYQFKQFSAWLGQIKQHTIMINPVEIIEWNLNKKYLIDLENKGIRIVDSIIIEQGKNVALDSFFQQFNTSDFVVKPLISGSARHTFKVTHNNITNTQLQFNQLIQHEGFIAQPFQQSIMSHGEISLMVIDGQFTHAVLKKSRAGDFRVQDEHGGTVHPYFASAEEIKFAEQTIAACNPKPMYARVDLIRNNKDQLVLMELELIEPELFFRFEQSATFKLADSVFKFLKAI